MYGSAPAFQESFEERCCFVESLKNRVVLWKVEEGGCFVESLKKAVVFEERMKKVV